MRSPNESVTTPQWAGKENFLPVGEDVDMHAMCDEVLRLRGVLARTGGYGSSRGHEGTLQEKGQIGWGSAPVVLHEANVASICMDREERRY